MRNLYISLFIILSFNLFSQDFYSDRLFVKIKDEYKFSFLSIENEIVDKIIPAKRILSFKRAFKSPELSSIYEMVLKDSLFLDSALEKLTKLGYVEYAERIPNYKLFYTPNDPQYSSQWNLAKIQADLAWNLGQGCSNVKIAVTDDGFLMNHEDLQSKWYVNSSEINGNGIDDDGNGYIDDWRGWDAANNDNDPSAFNPTNSYFTHGTHVAGIVAAHTNNNLGIASIGFNCMMIPVKIGTNSNSSLTGAYQGLDYAINASGCDVINMSWGGGGFSTTYQILFNLAKAKGIICVAAAGNSNSSSPMYPASYNHVISVAASSITDARASFSNYGSTIDVTAPGVNILSSLAGATNSYGNLSGTSMASPLVAGLCALMKCYNPMPADSIEACLKRTCDNINTQNPSFIGQLGAGRINAFQALQCLTQKPKSDFMALDTFQCIGKSVRYVAKSFGVPTLTYNWSFLGGIPAISTLKNPIVTYSSNGYKSVTLITCNGLGCDTITKTSIVNIDTPKAWLMGRKYTSYNSNPVIVTVNFKGNPPYNVTLTDGTNNFSQTNIHSNPYFFSITPKSGTSYISIQNYSDSSCIGNKYGVDTVSNVMSSGGGGQSYCESSFSFDGTNNNVVKIDPQNGAAWKDLYSVNGFTWECWFNLGNRSSTSFTNTESLMGATDAQLCEDIGLHFNWPNWSGSGKFNWVVSGQTGCSVPHGVISTNMVFNPNTWYHAAGTMDYATNTLKLYVDGNLVNTGTMNIPFSQRMKNNVAVTIGNQDINYNPYWQFSPFKGKIDEVRFWNSVRTQAEIQANMKSCLPSTTANLVAYFKGDEGTGTNTVSKINGNFVGTLQNGATWSTQVDSVKNCTLCPTTLCRDSIEVNSAQSGWQALQTNGTWGGLIASSYCAGTFAANSSLFPGMSATDCLWGPIISTGTRTAYNSSSHTSTSTFSGSFPLLRKQFTLPVGSIIDSVRLWMISDDYIDSVWVNNKMVYKATNPVHYGQIVMTGSDLNLGNSISPLNEVIVKPGDFGGCYGTYFRMKVFYSKVCGNLSQDCDTSGLILCMSMDGNANDSTKYNNHGIIRGVTPTTDRNGTSNGAYYFNGTTSYITLGVKPMLKPSAASISVWVKPQAFNSYIGGNANCIILTKNPNNPGSFMEAYSLYLTNRSGPTKFMTVSTHQPTSNEKWFQSVQNTSLNQWTHLVLTFDYDSLKLYVNGQLDNKTYKGFNNVYDALDSIMIGYSANTLNKNYFKGDMDELKMYNRVLSPTEVLNLYTKPFTCSCATLKPPQSDCDTTNLNTGLIAYYPLDGNAQDLSGNNNHGTAMGGLTYISGKKDQAANYDGINDYINLNKKLLQGLSDFSVTGWVYLNQNLAYPKGFNIYRENNNGWNGAGIDLLIGNYNLSKYTMAASWSNGSGTGMQSYAIWENTIDSGKWYCFTLTRSSDTMKLYLNGQLSQSKYHPFTNTPTSDGILGGWWFNNDPSQTAYSKGYLDDVRFYNRTLALSEIKGYCGTCTVQPPIDTPKCTKPQKYTITKCTNADVQLSARVGSQYQWSPKLGLSSDTVKSPWTNVKTNQIYLVSYLDTAKCQIVDTFVVKVKSTAPYFSISDQLICFGDSVRVSIPISASNILWSPNIGISNVSSSSPYLFPTTNQTYYLRFTDTAGCVQFDTVVVNVKICCPARARYTLSDTMLCFGNNLLITNQSKGAINFYDWKFGNAIPSSHNTANPPVIQFPNGGTYPIRLIVGNGVCFDTMIRNVYVVEVKPWAGDDTTNCLAAFSTQLGDYPISDWTYSWTPTTYLNGNTIANPICNIINDSVRYILEITDKFSGCKGYDTVVVKTGRNIPSNTVNKRICFGDSTLFYGSYKKTKGQYFNTIKKINSTCDSFIDVLNLDVLTPVKIQNSDERYCNYYIDKKGKRYDVSYTFRDTIRSKTLNCDSLITNTNILIFKVKYDTVDIKNCKEVLFKGKRYTASKKNIDSTKIISANSGCDSIVTRYNAIVYPIPNAVIVASKPNPIVYADTVTLTAKGGGSYLWLHNSSIDSTIIHRSEDTMYKIYIVRVTDSNNCWDTASYLVKGILPDTLFYGIPRAFSPNGDNMNDVFIPNMNYGISINEFFVWNRWGEKMWETHENKGWDGYYKGKLAPPGVYVYYVLFNTPWGKREYKGSFVLMR